MATLPKGARRSKREDPQQTPGAAHPLTAIGKVVRQSKWPALLLRAKAGEYLKPSELADLWEQRLRLPSDAQRYLEAHLAKLLRRTPKRGRRRGVRPRAGVGIGGEESKIDRRSRAAHVATEVLWQETAFGLLEIPSPRPRAIKLVAQQYDQDERTIRDDIENHLPKYQKEFSEGVREWAKHVLRAAEERGALLLTAARGIVWLDRKSVETDPLLSMLPLPEASADADPRLHALAREKRNRPRQ